MTSRRQPPARHTGLVAVLTGNLIGFSRITPERKDLLYQSLETSLAPRSVRRIGLPFKVLGRQIFRGDSYQLVLDRPEPGLSAALHITASLRVSKAAEGARIGTRIALGIGSADHIAVEHGPRARERQLRGDGQAYRLSGPKLDEMKKARRLVLIRTPWPAVDAELDVACRFLDILLDQMSASQARAILGLLHGKTQEAIAAEEQISQSAVAQRLQRANAGAILALVTRYQELMDQHATERRPTDPSISDMGEES